MQRNLEQNTVHTSKLSRRSLGRAHVRTTWSHYIGWIIATTRDRIEFQCVGAVGLATLLLIYALVENFATSLHVRINTVSFRRAFN